MSETQTLAARRVSDSLTTMTEFVLPTHANPMGNVFGGQILAWVDLCGSICAVRHAGQITITAGIDDLSFEGPIRVGQVVRLTAQVTATFRTSIEVLVQVVGEEATTGEHWSCVRAFVTYVAVDASLRPSRVPPVEFESDAQRQLALAATQRRAARLARRPEHHESHRPS